MGDQAEAIIQNIDWYALGQQLRKVLDRIAEAFSQLIEEANETLKELFNTTLSEMIKSVQRQKQRPPKKLGIQYNYIPAMPRNLPYQQRKYM